MWGLAGGRPAGDLSNSPRTVDPHGSARAGVFSRVQRPVAVLFEGSRPVATVYRSAKSGGHSGEHSKPTVVCKCLVSNRSPDRLEATGKDLPHTNNRKTGQRITGYTQKRRRDFGLQTAGRTAGEQRRDFRTLSLRTSSLEPNGNPGSKNPATENNPGSKNPGYRSKPIHPGPDCNRPT